MKTLCPFFRVTILGAVVAAAIAGCAKKDTRPQRVPVTGTVLYKGQPAADATVIFEPTGATPAATGQTNASGQFKLTTYDADDGAAPGEYKVAVRKVQVISGERPTDAPDDLAAPPPDEKWLLPAKYGHTTSSGLSATVQAGGSNEFKFELVD